MKRTVLVALFLTLLSAAVYAASSRFTISPNDLKDGETKTFGDGDRSITVHRGGDSIEVKIGAAGKARRIVIDSNDGEIHIGGGEGPRVFSFNGDGALPRMFMDGNIPSIQPRQFKQRTQTWFVCPKDHTMLRVPEGKDDAKYNCPLDGTAMEKREGHGFSFFFDDEKHHEEM
jgi:hypothetical protein